ncbi:MAG: 16S rRNA (cytosine(967)-C(5))-methyltransferase RsmB [Thermodesulfobacteriota bacterium]
MASPEASTGRTKRASARGLALALLNRISQGQAYANILMRSSFKLNRLSPHDRALVTELVYGTLRWQAKLDTIIALHSHRPLNKLSRDILNILRTGVYQLLWLDRIPAFAAVNEAVGLAREKVGQSGANFVNAVLRAVVKSRGRMEEPDPKTASLDELAGYYSQPAWLLENWRGQWGLERAIKLAVDFNQRPPLTARVNRLRSSRAKLLALLKKEVKEAQPTRYSPDGLILQGVELDKLASYRHGLITIQDEASQLVTHLLDPQPGETILDSCAAPGTKSTHAAQLMGNQGRILALDISGAKLGLVNRECRRLGITNISCVRADTSRALPVGRRFRFDRILLDAPCSGTGVIRRHPEGKWRQPDIKSLVGLQRKLLSNLVKYLKVKGTLVYSVCSTDRREGEMAVEEVLKRDQGLRFDPEVPAFAREALAISDQPGSYRTYPSQGGMDGFYMAKIKRES